MLLHHRVAQFSTILNDFECALLGVSFFVAMAAKILKQNFVSG